MVWEDSIHFGWKKKTVFNRGSGPKSKVFLKKENEVMENYLKTYARFIQGFPGILIFEPAFVIKSMLRDETNVIEYRRPTSYPDMEYLPGLKKDDIHED